MLVSLQILHLQLHAFFQGRQILASLFFLILALLIESGKTLKRHIETGRLEDIFSGAYGCLCGIRTQLALQAMNLSR